MILPDLPYLTTPNESARNPAGRKPTLIVVHAWGNKPATTQAQARSLFAGNVNYMRTASSQVSAHVVYGGTLADPRGAAVQLVEWQRKAWTEAAVNSAGISIESADAIWHGHDDGGLEQLARIVAYLCKRTNIPPRWAKTPAGVGVARHLDLGALGNPNHHVCPTGDVLVWKRFMRLVLKEHKRGGFRKTWGRGELRPL